MPILIGKITRQRQKKNHVEQNSGGMFFYSLLKRVEEFNIQTDFAYFWLSSEISVNHTKQETMSEIKF